MNFDFNDDQHEIKRTARELLTARSPFEKVRAAAEGGGYDDALWRELCELGWPGIAVGEEHGGQGLGTLELVILAEELGYACAPVPLLGSAMAAALLSAAGDDDQRARWLPGLATGELRGALGDSPELVRDAPGADVIVLAGEAGAKVVEGGADAVEVIDATVAYGSVAASGAALTGDVDGGVQRATIALAAELVGLAQRATEMTVAYVKDRKQFDVPVGSFQAVSHRCAQMLCDTEGARSALYYAAWAADADPARLPGAASLAKAAASEAARSVTASAIQAHGGIGFTWEADVHWLYKRAQVGAALLGGGRAHRAKVAALAARTPAAA